jgi:hypothetical protein
VALEFREACNKVVHAERVRLSSSLEGPLRSQVILEGVDGGRPWCAKLDVLRFAELATYVSSPMKHTQSVQRAISAAVSRQRGEAKKDVRRRS